MILSGRTISKGRAEGRVLKLEGALSFLGGVESSTGEVKVENGGNVHGRILVFPRGKGSTVGSFVMYDLKAHGKEPAAVINASAETIVATGAVISSIPMVDQIDVKLIRDGDDVIVNADGGTVELLDVKKITVVSSAVMIDGKVLLLRRPDTARSYAGYWSLCAGKLEKDESLEEAAIREIKEETQIVVDKAKGSLPPIYVREGGIIWEVYPFIFDAGSATPVLNKENVEYKLLTVDEMRGMKLVDYTIEVTEQMLPML